MQQHYNVIFDKYLDAAQMITPEMLDHIKREVSSNCSFFVINDFLVCIS